MAFAKKKETCLGCKSVLSDDSAVCSHCELKKSEIFQREVSPNPDERKNVSFILLISAIEIK